MNRETATAYGLASIGAVEGICKYYVRPELTAKRAWTAMGIGILAYEIACPQGELLSEGADRALESHRALTLGGIGLVALHLANVIPQRYDPLTQGLKLLKRG